MSDSGKILGLCDECGAQYGHFYYCNAGKDKLITGLEHQVMDLIRKEQEQAALFGKLQAEYEACKKVNQILLKEKTGLEEENQKLRTVVTELETEIEGLLTSP